MTRRSAAALLALSALIGGCSDKGDGETFCRQVREAPDVAEVLARLDPSDPEGVRADLEDAQAAFSDLEASAPGEIRDDVGVLRKEVDRLLDAVEKNPDDLAAVRRDLDQSPSNVAGLGRAGLAVNSYTTKECGIDLVEDLGGDPSPATTADGQGPATTG